MSDEDAPPVLTAHDLARQLLAGPDIEVWISTECCGCFTEVGGCKTSRYRGYSSWTDCVVITEERVDA